MTFGPGCYNVEVKPFNPICSHPEIPASKPLAFEVPVPSFVSPTPPNECVCLSFSADKTTPGKKGCQEEAKCSVEIVQDGDDCCAGKYKVIPHIEFPCLPFSIEEAAASLVIADNPSKVGAKLTFEKRCETCSIQPTLEIVVPPQFASCFEVRGNPECPECAPVSASSAKREKTKKKGPVRIMEENIPSFVVRAKYKKGGEEVCTDPAAFEITHEWDAEKGCEAFTIGSAVLDLTDVGGGVSNGGGVNMMTDGGTLEIDGTPLSDGDTWVGGGYGDLAGEEDNTDLESTFCRGHLMRGTDAASPAGAGDQPVLTTMIEQTNFVCQNPRSTGGERTITTWKSNRVEKEESAEGRYSWSTTPGFGNLNIVWPTGYQWHRRGVALTLTEFMFNPSGVLSLAEEKGEAILMSPAPAFIKPNATDMWNASGLSIYNVNTARTNLMHGLAVKDGPGLRIHGIDARTLEWGTSWNYNTEEQGQLETYVGRGVQTAPLVDPKAGPDYRTYRLEVKANADDFMFVTTKGAAAKGTAEGEESAKLMINDWYGGAVDDVADHIPQSETDPAYDWTWFRNNAEGKELLLAFPAGYDDAGVPVMLSLRVLKNGVIAAAGWKPALIAPDKDSSIKPDYMRTDRATILDKPALGTDKV